MIGSIDFQQRNHKLLLPIRRNQTEMSPSNRSRWVPTPGAKPQHGYFLHPSTALFELPSELEADTTYEPKRMQLQTAVHPTSKQKIKGPNRSANTGSSCRLQQSLPTKRDRTTKHGDEMPYNLIRQLIRHNYWVLTDVRVPLQKLTNFIVHGHIIGLPVFNNLGSFLCVPTLRISRMSKTNRSMLSW